jgi:hypothetical protein
MFVTSVAARFAISFSYFFASIVLGALAMGLFWYQFPDQFVQLQRSASSVRDWIAAHAWSTRTESILRFLLEERQLLLISFVLAVRFLLGLLISLLAGLALQLKARLGGG